MGGGGGGVGVGSGLGGFPNASPLTGSANLENAATEIDRIMAKIEQDNKILAELEKSRSTIGKICEIFFFTCVSFLFFSSLFFLFSPIRIFLEGNVNPLCIFFPLFSKKKIYIGVLAV